MTKGERIWMQSYAGLLAWAAVIAMVFFAGAEMEILGAGILFGVIGLVCMIPWRV